jgi:hypothetical protein
MELSARWGARSRAAFGDREAQALFGIQQGSTFEPLRRESSERLQEIGFDGYAIGGLAVGEGHGAMLEVLDYAPALLPAERPRYLMGVGKPIDLVEAVARGVDMFDCVLPTRSGRHGQAWTWNGPLNVKNARWAEDDSPLDESSACPASRDYAKAYLHHLFKAGEILGQVLLSWHNLAFYGALTAAMREAIAEGRFEAFRRDFVARQGAGGDSVAVGRLSGGLGRFGLRRGRIALRCCIIFDELGLGPGPLVSRIQRRRGGFAASVLADALQEGAPDRARVDRLLDPLLVALGPAELAHPAAERDDADRRVAHGLQRRFRRLVGAKPVVVPVLLVLGRVQVGPERNVERGDFRRDARQSEMVRVW